jgi:hypothetical protein
MRISAKKKPAKTIQGYDLVGDIHGHADALHRLLHKLDYTEVEGVFRHPQRKMIFVGDFIDRGPRQREVLRIARSMCEAGARAVKPALARDHAQQAIRAVPRGTFLRRLWKTASRQNNKALG